MKIGPIINPSIVPTNPLKPLQVKTIHTKHTVMFGGTFPVPGQSDTTEYEIPVQLFGATPAASRAIIGQLLELAMNAEWQRAGLYLQMREDLNDAQDGWYGLGQVEIPEEDPGVAGWATATIDVLLRGRRSAGLSMYVDQKGQVNDFSLASIPLAVFPQGIADPYPAATWTWTAADGSTIRAIENSPSVIRGQLSNPINTMSLGRCAIFDSSTTPTGSDIEVFNGDHRWQNRYVRITNGLINYVIDLQTPGDPETDTYTGAAWLKVGNFSLQSYSGSAYTSLPVQSLNVLVVSPEEIVWEELRYDNAGTGLARVTNRMRRGTFVIETQVVSASGQGLTGANSISFTSVPAGVTGVATGAASDVYVGTGGTVIPGFLFLDAPANTGITFTTTVLDSGISVPQGTLKRFGLFLGNPNGGMWTAFPTEATYASRWAVYNRMRIRQRILIAS